MIIVNKKWEELTPELITNLYLYGQETKPTTEQLLSDKWIDRQETVKVNITNQNSFVLNGPGRFANASQIEVVDNFFLGTVLGDQGDGKQHVYSFRDGHYYEDGTNNIAYFDGSRSYSLAQYDYSGTNDADWANRTYIYNSV